MDSLNDKLTEEEKIIFILKELYEKAKEKEEKEKWKKLLIRCYANIKKSNLF